MDTIVTLAAVVAVLTSLLCIPMVIVGLTLALKLGPKARAYDQHLKSCAREQNDLSRVCIGSLFDGVSFPMGATASAGTRRTASMDTTPSLTP